MPVTMLLLAFLIGVVAGLRTMTALAAVGFAARAGALPLAGTWLWWLGATWTPWILLVLAIAELVGDKLPATPSRTAPPGFVARIIAGGLCGAAFGAPVALTVAGVVAGVLGAVIGTVGGAAARARLAHAFRRDMPAALLEDLVAVGGAILIVSVP